MNRVAADELEGARQASTDGALLNLMVSREQLSRPLEWAVDPRECIDSVCRGLLKR